MDECVIERGKYSSYAENEFTLQKLERDLKISCWCGILTFSDLRAQRYVLSGRTFDLLFGWHDGELCADRKN